MKREIHECLITLYLAIDENTNTLVVGDRLEVIGQHYVLVFEGTFWYQKTGSNEKGDRVLHLLGKGRKYDMITRKVLPRD